MNRKWVPRDVYIVHRIRETHRGGGIGIDDTKFTIRFYRLIQGVKLWVVGKHVLFGHGISSIIGSPEYLC
jgi:hypothetical protein